MFRNIRLPLLVAMCTSSAAFSQPADLFNITAWPDKPALHTVPARYKDASAFYLMDSRTFHYKTEGKNIVQYNYVYRLIKVADDKGIEMFNKVYVPFSRDMEITDIKARVITSAGKIIDVPASKIKEEEDEGRLYKLFAMEGIDKGSEVEYAYTIKKKSLLFWK